MPNNLLDPALPAAEIESPRDDGAAHENSPQQSSAKHGISPQTVKLAIAGTIAGLITGLLGGGGGTVLVPMLVLWVGYEHRKATGTSLVAVAVMSGAAAALQGFQGNVDLAKALEIGIPAIGGVVFGTWLHHRIHADVLGLLFGLLLIGVAINMVVK